LLKSFITNMTPIARDVESPRRPAGGAIGNVLWSSAVDAFVKTMLILVMGNVALISESQISKTLARFLWSRWRKRNSVQ
jgi:hypothetical protein